MRIINSGALALAIDNGDKVELVFDRYTEQPVIELHNSVWVEEPRYLAFIGTEPERQIREFIDALQELLPVARQHEAKSTGRR